MAIEITQLKWKDLDMVVQWTKDWINSKNPSAYSLTTFSSANYYSYLQFQYSIPFSHNSTKLVGAYNGDELAGFAEFRIIEEQCFINNICVKEGKRGLGIGESLLKYAVQSAKQLDLQKISLDCFTWNERAQKKYLDWGFNIVSTAYWLLGENPYKEMADQIDFLIDDYVNATACHDALGFSRFQVKTKMNNYTVNRIKDKYYRVIVQDNTIDNILLRILGQIDPKRSIFVISPNKEIINAIYLEKVSSSIRMEYSLS